MNYAQIRRYDISNGIGIRTSIFLSGCRFNCKNCFNIQYQNFCYGEEFTDETLNTVLAYVSDDNVKGLSILGGEPLMQDSNELLKLVKTVKENYPYKDIWLWTGHRFNEIPCKYEPVLKYVDVLIDGRFEENKKDLTLKWRGSSNQRIIDVQKTIKFGNIVERTDLY